MQSRSGLELEKAYARTAVRIAELEDMPVGPTMIAGLHALRHAVMDSAGAVRCTVLWTKVGSWYEAQKMLAIDGAMSGAGQLPGITAHEAIPLIAEEIAVATNSNGATTAHQVGLAVTVGSQMGTSWEALDRADLTIAHVKALARATEHCTPRVTEAVDALLVPLALEFGWTPAKLAKEAAKAILAIDPDGAADRAAAAKADADVTLYPRPDETAEMVARGDAVALRRVKDTIDARALQMGADGDQRPVGVRRLAALAEFVLDEPSLSDSATMTTRCSSGAATRGGRAQQRRRRRQARRCGEATVRIDYTTLLGLNDQPGELVGYGPITAQTARRIAKDASLRRIVTDPLTGEAMDLGRTRYRPSAELREWIEERDRTCTFPGCGRPAVRCDLDHRRDWDLEGETNADNLHCLCRKHHNFKTKKLWHVDINPDGSETWTSALGFRYTKRVNRYPIVPLEPPDDDLPDDSDELVLHGDLDPPYPTEVSLPEPPPLDRYEIDELDDALSHGWGGYADRVYDVLRAADLVG
jgi:hypothetical protein